MDDWHHLEGKEKPLANQRRWAPPQHNDVEYVTTSQPSTLDEATTQGFDTAIALRIKEKLAWWIRKPAEPCRRIAHFLT